MNSATSIEQDVQVSADRDARDQARPQPRDTFGPWHFFVLMSLIAATAAVIMARQSRPEHLVVISLTVGAAGFAAGALYRTLAPLVSDKAPAGDVPLTESLRAGLEREKALVLRSIKELEFDRAMGKVSAKDFDEMAGRLRMRAMSLMRQLDAGSAYRELIERELSARLRRRSPARPSRAGDPLRNQPARQDRTTSSRPAPLCACGTQNDVDAAFCKRCGARLEPLSS